MMVYTTQQMREMLAELRQVFDPALFDQWLSRQENLDPELNEQVVREQRMHFTVAMSHRHQARKLRGQMTEIVNSITHWRQQVENYESYADQEGSNLQKLYQQNTNILEQFEECRELMILAIEMHASALQQHDKELQPMESLQKFLSENTPCAEA